MSRSTGDFSKYAIFVLLALIPFVPFVVEQVWILVSGSARSYQLEAGSCFSSGWIFHPLDDPYRLFFNNDAGSSGIAEFAAKFFLGEYSPNCLHSRSWKPSFTTLIFSVFVNRT